MEYQFVKIVVYVPSSHADKVREALVESGCGHIGNYDSCSFSVKGVGRFRPLEGANPHIGKIGDIEKVEEERIETVCPFVKLKEVLSAVRAVHPYEEPAIDVCPLLN
ncbi:hypothetical protein HZC20_03360 [Candidatus Peregrinibacteria bacterium]|nr:hypothetical protein [Candidatus Peregrinibacteria bacterium]